MMPTNYNNNGDELNNIFDWEREKWKYEVMNHPLYDQRLGANVSPIDLSTSLLRHHIATENCSTNSYPNTKNSIPTIMMSTNNNSGGDETNNNFDWEREKWKNEIMNHTLYDQQLATHMPPTWFNNPNFCHHFSTISEDNNANSNTENNNQAIMMSANNNSGGDEMINSFDWGREKWKSGVINHPLYSQLLDAHVSHDGRNTCLLSHQFSTTNKDSNLIPNAANSISSMIPSNINCGVDEINNSFDWKREKMRSEVIDHPLCNELLDAHLSPSGLNTSHLLHHFATINDDTNPNPNTTYSIPAIMVSDNNNSGGNKMNNSFDWEKEKWKSEIMNHPLYNQLLATHVSCLRITTPVDQFPKIDAQLEAHSQHMVAQEHQQPNNKELDHFMTQYVQLLSSLKEKLQQHVQVHAREAVMGCWELQQSLQNLTGVALGEGTGLTMFNDDHTNIDQFRSLDVNDNMEFGPPMPTESERAMMEHIKHELKQNLKQGYKEKIMDLREGILRKSTVVKLHGDTTQVLKAWWESHIEWPYPTEEEKVKLMQETGLKLKQINTWFTNRRRRKWNNNASTSTNTQGKRKSVAEKKK